MIKKTVSYEGFDGETITEDLYFHFNKAELMELEVETDRGFSKKLQAVAEAKDVREVLAVFKDIVVRSYGVRSEDGKRFIKTERAREEFDGSEAYSEVLFDLLSNPANAARFVGGLMPSDLLEKAKAESNLDIEKMIQELEEEEAKKDEPKDESKDISTDDESTELRVVDEEEDLSTLSHEELVARLKISREG